MESFINSKDIQTIRAFSDRAAEEGRLTPELLQLIYSNNWFNLYVPRKLGGLELTLPEALTLLEQLASADGSLGWTVTLCAGANWFAGFLPEETRKDFFTGPATCLSGSGLPGGIAEVVEGGYRVNGYWKYATGAPHATAFTANCYIKNNGDYLKDENGIPVVRSFIFTPEEVITENDWHTMGMKATASYSFRVQQVYVPAQRSFTIEATQSLLPDPVFYFPFLPFAEATLAANFSGMAMHWLQLCEERFGQKRRGEAYTPEQEQIVGHALRQTGKAFREVRASFFDTVYTVWNEGAGSKQWNKTGLETVSTLSHHLVVTAFSSVQQLYPWCGLEAATENTALNRIWLDIHTARQHSLFRYSQAATF